MPKINRLARVPYYSSLTLLGNSPVWLSYQGGIREEAETIGLQNLL